ncbi:MULTISPECIES: iron-containing redox enzyme family protein [Cyanophyceae]|uniref:iron-containing redox enzyme family protein n=1 Tax=Cyanophyceae TaxID=3028117 RepID=UPI0016884F10|nr:MULTISPECIES: iron-containing redox enzyme family protein [Cyanophyceae]MBD1915770.1 iron-containing redox enzyme family protein [Phormidium sp. FACHB-77]MBD2030043.1 iron-containing redox enzyme family protein [Phormidium sp. FACHB-322]MBD2052155.1 iron-containing redox enzyme family protein [Leptolyngbya sp. FACHB-60]
MAQAIRPLIETQYAGQVQAFEYSPWFQRLEQGQASLQEYDAFIFNLCQTHLKSPQILAFLYAVAPPEAAPQIKHNLLEELGLDEVAICHPDLLYQLATAAGFDRDRQASLAQAAQAQIRQLCTDPLLFGTMQELGLSVLLEVTCFEWMLSRLAGRIGQALATHRGLSPASLAWFDHHSEVDIRHAEEGLDSVEQYLAYYEIEAEDLETILDITFRENIFIKRYFADLPLLAGSAHENR